MSRVRIPSLAPIFSAVVNAVTVYVLRFEAGELYVGLTSNLERRLAEHQRRQSPSTLRLKGNFTVVHQEVLADYRTARSREKFLKSGAGRAWLVSVTA
ncbi:MAG TPA: endonuclease [Verrucomicrobiales bacterium]|nr:endonuclease [Verrucomicrobiales bacterium]